jgi:hypothetical protein
LAQSNKSRTWVEARKKRRRRRGAGDTAMGAYRTDAAFVRAVARMDTPVDAATALVTLDRLITEARELVELSMRRAQAWIIED